jgi:hypothetical protein
MFMEARQDDPASLPAEDGLRRVYVSVAAGAFLLTVAAAAAVLSIWEAGRHLARRLRIT